MSQSSITEATIARLKDEARRASRRAYCPYSRFPVGAAILTDGDQVVTGCNVENASYGLTICAERAAIFRMIAEGGTTVLMVVVYTPTSEPTAPCGACRQVLAEFGRGASVRVLSFCDGPRTLDAVLSDLLPQAFKGPTA